MDNVDHLGFLLQLCELELIEREKRAAERRLKAARFPNPKTLDTFDFTAQPSLNRLLVTELMRCAYLDNRESVILIGNPGTGKTHIATALAVEACGRGKRVRFWKVTELITHLIEVREERQLARMKSQLAKLDLLVLDKLGYVPTSKLGAELLFEVISTAYEPDRNQQPALQKLDGGRRQELPTPGRPSPSAAGQKMTRSCSQKENQHVLIVGDAIQRPCETFGIGLAGR